MSGEPEIQVTDNRDEARYEAHLDGEPAGRLYYRERPDSIVFVHTEVDEEYEGHGIGGRLVSGALDDIRSRGLSVTPLCQFAAGYIRRHPEYADLVAA